jgi:hypothetical protein
MSPLLAPTADSGTPPADRWARRCRVACRAAALLLCGLHAWVARHTMNPDGVSYLDMADAYARGDLGSAVNSYWSPLYAWAVGGALALLRPSAYWECAVAHGVNFAVFLGALAAFEWFLHELVLAHRDGPAGVRGTLPEWALVGLAYTLFAWTSRQLVTVSFVTPDMGVAAFVYLAAALLLRARRAGPTPWGSALLGAVLGAAYLAKAVMFPLGWVFLGVAALAGGTLRRRAGHLALATLCFLAVSGGFVAALSAAKGRVTFGDSGRLNYAWYVGGVPRPHWLGGAGGEPAHPPRRLLASPAVYEFGGPVGGTYPLWYDPPYWYEGVAAAAPLREQLAASARTAMSYLALLLGRLACFTTPVVLLYVLDLRHRTGPWGGRLRACSLALARQYPLLLPALAAAGMYLLVGHVEGRLIGPFLVLLAAGALAAVRAPAQAAARVAGVSLGLIGLALAGNLLYDAGNACRAVAAGEGPAAHPAWRVAGYLGECGLRAGDEVGFVGYTFDAYWARLGGYRIVAEVPEGEAAKFWAADRAVQGRVMGALRRAGVRAAVAGPLPRAPAGWAEVSGTGYYVYDLREGAVAGASRRVYPGGDGPRRSPTSKAIDTQDRKRGQGWD